MNRCIHSALPGFGCHRLLVGRWWRQRLRVLYKSGLIVVWIGLLEGPLIGRSFQEITQRSHQVVRGMTISCQTWGQEWGTDGFGRELDELATLGVNWVAIHPYARIREDGGVQSWHLDDANGPEWLVRPIHEAHARGFSILIKPHLAYWGSPFSWRGEIAFAETSQRERFFQDYANWILRLAELTTAADAFVVGTELDRMLDETRWRQLIEDVRECTAARLTYAANWTDYQRVPFWDALDAIGVQAYFPLTEREEAPSEAELLASWQRVLAPMRELAEQTGKPIVFTELGYDQSVYAAKEPWRGGHRGTVDEQGRALQMQCYQVALQVLHQEQEWVRGAFLWKWFVGEAPWADFRLDQPHLRHLIQDCWN